LRGGSAAGILPGMGTNPPMTADDLWPLVQKLSRRERLRLARLALTREALASDATDEERYQRLPPGEDEFVDAAPDREDDPLGWDAEGWDGAE